MRRLLLEGTLFSGKEEGMKFIILPWVTRQIKEKLGFEPFPGTLNLKLSERDMKNKAALDRSKGIEILPPLGYCRGRLFKAEMGKIDCAIVIPDVLDYPKDTIEIIASENLRKRLQLFDGSKVEVYAFI